MLRKYETIVIHKPETTDEVVLETTQKIEDIAKNFGGEVLVKDDWGKLKTAFEVKKNNKGRFVYYQYSAEGQMVAELERNLRNNDEVIRFLTVKVSPQYDYIKIRNKLDFISSKRKPLFAPQGITTRSESNNELAQENFETGFDTVE